MSIKECEEHINEISEKFTCGDFVRLSLEGALKRYVAFTFSLHTACESHPMGNLQIAQTTTVQASDSETANYLVSEYTVKDMPFAEHRMGIKESAIVLAFPVDDEWRPKVES